MMANFANNYSEEQQQKCNHSTLTFCYSDYYVMCTICNRTWVKASMTSDKPDSEHLNSSLAGEVRYELTLDRIKILVEDSNN